MSKEVRIVSLVFAILLIGVCVLLNENIETSKDSNKLQEVTQETLIRQEYERVLLGCNSAGAIDSEDPWLRELCDETLPEIRDEMLRG